MQKMLFWQNKIYYLGIISILLMGLSLPMFLFVLGDDSKENTRTQIYVLEKKLHHLQMRLEQITHRKKHGIKTQFYTKAILLQKYKELVNALALSSLQKKQLKNIIEDFYLRQSYKENFIWKILDTREQIQKILTFSQNHLYLKKLRSAKSDF